MKILILLGLGRETDSFAMGRISPLGATYCKSFVQKPVGRGLKNGFLGFFEISFPTTQNMYCSFQVYRGIIIHSKVHNKPSIFWRQIHGCHQCKKFELQDFLKDKKVHSPGHFALPNYP